MAGLLFAPVVKLGCGGQIPGLDATISKSESTAAPSLATAARTLAAKPSFWLLSLAAASGSIVGYGLIFWLPSFFKRSLTMDLADVAWFYGSIVLVGGIIGIWLGGWLGDRLGQQKPGAYAVIPALCLLAAVPVYAAAFATSSLLAAWILFAMGQMLGLSWLGPVIAAIQHIMPRNMRATASASFLFINNLIGIGFGTFFFGLLSDRMHAVYGEDALLHSILYGLGFYLLAGALYILAAMRMRQDWFQLKPA